MCHPLMWHLRIPQIWRTRKTINTSMDAGHCVLVFKVEGKLCSQPRTFTHPVHAVAPNTSVRKLQAAPCPLKGKKWLQLWCGSSHESLKSHEREVLAPSLTHVSRTPISIVNQAKGTLVLDVEQENRLWTMHEIQQEVQRTGLPASWLWCLEFIRTKKVPVDWKSCTFQSLCRTTGDSQPPCFWWHAPACYDVFQSTPSLCGSSIHFPATQARLWLSCAASHGWPPGTTSFPLDRTPPALLSTWWLEKPFWCETYYWMHVEKSAEKRVSLKKRAYQQHTS